MKNMKKLLALALVIVSVLAISIPALAIDTDGYDDYIGPGTSSGYNVRKGQINQRVENLQIMLVYAGYNPGTVDGNFGTNTENAVKRFQSVYGLTSDGIVGKNTKEMLWMALGFQAPPECGMVDKTIRSDDLPHTW